LKGSARPTENFGLHCNMLRAKSLKDVVETASRWRDIGGTHASVVTMGQGFTSTDQHIDHMKKVADALQRASLGA
jgi:hypothetical protein